MPALRSAEPDRQLGYAQDEYGFVVVEQLKLLRGEDVEAMLIGRLVGVWREDCVELRLEVEARDMFVEVLYQDRNRYLVYRMSWKPMSRWVASSRVWYRTAI